MGIDNNKNLCCILMVINEIGIFTVPNADFNFDEIREGASRNIYLENGAHPGAIGRKQ